MLPWKSNGAVLLIVLALNVIAASSAWYARGVLADLNIAALKQAHSEAVEEATRKSLVAEQRAREEESRTSQLIQEIADAERIRMEMDAALVASNRALRASLRNRADAATDALIAEVAQAATPAERSAAIAGTGLLFAEVLDSCSTRLVDVAAWADEAHARGRACEAAYQGLTQAGEQ